MTAATRQYTCPHCAEVFNNPDRLGGHVRARHPEHKRPRRPGDGLGKQYDQRRPYHQGVRAHPDDRWPGRP